MLLPQSAVVACDRAFFLDVIEEYRPSKLLGDEFPSVADIVIQFAYQHAVEYIAVKYRECSVAAFVNKKLSHSANKKVSQF